VESIGCLILYLRDVDVSAAFYRDVVGLPFKLRDAGNVEFVTGGTRFGPAENQTGHPRTHSATKQARQHNPGMRPFVAGCEKHPSQGGDTGSNPVGTTRGHKCRVDRFQHAGAYSRSGR